MIKEIGLIFDMDGVIVDNHKFHYLSWLEFAKKYGITIDEPFYLNNMNGRTFKNIMHVLFEEPLSTTELKKRSDEKEELYRELYRDHQIPVPGLIDLLEEARSRDIPMVVGTSGPRENVDFTLDGLKIRGYFKTVVDASLVTHGKPHPEVYLKCAAAINKKNETCVVFEDAISGIHAAKAAGSVVVALATTMKEENIDNEHIIGDFRGLTVEKLQQILPSQ